MKKPRKLLTEAEKAEREKAKIANFEKLASPRTRRALKAIGLIGNLSGSGYASTKEQVEKIRTALQKKVDETMARFSKTTKTEDSFEL